MQETISIYNRINELRKIISTLQWDIPNIKNNRLRAKKESDLIRYKAELDELLEKARLNKQEIL